MTQAADTQRSGVLSQGLLSMLAYGMNFAASIFAIIGMIRIMGKEAYGLFSVALVVVAFTSMISDFGIGPVIMRRLAIAPGRAGSILLETTLARLLLFIPTWLVAVGVGLWLDPSAEFMLILHIMLINVLISSRLPVIRGTFDAFYRSQTRMAFPTITMAVDSMMLLVAVLVLPASFRDPVTAMMLYTGSNIVGAAILLGGSVRFARKLNTEPVRATWAGMRDLVITSAPLAVFLLLNALHTSIDTIYLKLFHGNEAAAIFNAAMRIMTPLAVFPTIIAISAAPMIARASAGAILADGDSEDSARMSRLFSLGFKTLLIGAVIIAGFGITNSEWLVTVVFSQEFSDSALPMALLFLTFLPMSLNIFLVEVNNARDRLRMNTRFAAVLAIVSVTVGALLIAQWSASGAAAAKLTAVVAGLAFLIMRAREGIHFAVTPLVWKGALLFAVLLALRLGLDPVNFWLANFVALIAVTAGIFLLRVYSLEEMALWKTQLAGLLRRKA